MKQDPNVWITPKAFANAYTRAFQPEISDVQTRKPAPRPKKK